MRGPLAGRLTDRIGSRTILMVGFVLFALGVGGVAAVESVTASTLTFTIPLALVGLGLGCVVAPLTCLLVVRRTQDAPDTQPAGVPAPGTPALHVIPEPAL